MEGTLQPLALAKLGVNIIGFNPCFNGRYSATPQNRWVPQKGTLFQSLF